MSSGRHPGDFWRRAPGFVPPGALPEEEMNLHSHDASEDGDILDRIELTEADEQEIWRILEDDDKTPMKRPSAGPRAVMKRCSARSAKAKSKEDNK